MKKFVVKILLFLCVFCMVDTIFIIFRYREVNLFSQITNQKLQILADYLHENKVDSVDIGIFGSSHAQFGVSPEIITTETNRTAINFAYGGGTNVGGQYRFITRLHLKMKVMVYILDVFSLNNEPSAANIVPASFFRENVSLAVPADIDTINKVHSFSEKAMIYSNIYLYSHFIPRYIGDIKKGIYKPPYFRKTDSFDLTMFKAYYNYSITPKGWVKGNSLLDKKFLRYAELSFQPRKAAITRMQDIADYCKENGIRLIIVQAPEHAAAQSSSQKYIDFAKWTNDFAAKNNIRFLNFDTPDAFPSGQDSLFFDTDHLSEKGATIFSKQLAKALINEGIR